MAKSKFEQLRASIVGAVNQPLILSVEGMPAMARIFQAAAAGRLGQISDEELGLMITGGDATQLPVLRAAEPGQPLAGQFDPVMIPSRTGRGGGTLYMSAKGVALYDLEFQPYAFSTQLLARRLAQAVADPNVSSIVLEMGTPGGVVTGTPESADALWAARQAGKKTSVVVNPLAASAGYWIASQAEKISSTPTGRVGSIGVYVLHMDASKLLADIGIKMTFIQDGPHKTEGNPFEPLSDEARDHIQEGVTKTGDAFRAAVARGRGVKASVVKSDWGGGRTFDAAEAKALGMIDRVETPLEAAARLGLIENSSARAEDGAGLPQQAGDGTSAEEIGLLAASADGPVTEKTDARARVARIRSGLKR